MPPFFSNRLFVSSAATAGASFLLNRSSSTILIRHNKLTVPFKKLDRLCAKPSQVKGRVGGLEERSDDGEMPNPGSTVNSQILLEVSHCAGSIGGAKEGRWKSTLTFYRPMLRDQSVPTEYPKDFLGLSLQEKSEKYYFIIRAQRIVIEADSSILAIMDKLQSYKARVSLNFEGLQYQVGDFQLRVGKVVPSNSESLRGIMMEVEYLPISSIEKSRQVMDDFFDIWQETVAKKSLPGHFMHIESNFADYGLQDQYSSQHTAVQYATVMAQLIASVRN